ncbi:MAG: hypothetical protein JSR39_10720 [Verrucomicrobia bacterium]|nr:hypothetical protein [Verrucomicrobiota bacterium]
MSSLQLSATLPQSHSLNQPAESAAGLAIAASSNITNQISSLPPEALREITGVELVAKSIIAGSIGILPFLVAKTGEYVVKASVHTEEFFRKNVFENLDRYAHYLLENERGTVLNAIGLTLFVSTWFFEIFSRAVIGIPAAAGGILLTGGAATFSFLQAQVWGQALVEHPQEERVNTRLARYGAGEKPWRDFQDLVRLFYVPRPPIINSEPDAHEIRRIQYWTDFDPT